MAFNSELFIVQLVLLSCCDGAVSTLIEVPLYFRQMAAAPYPPAGNRPQIPFELPTEIHSRPLEQTTWRTVVNTASVIQQQPLWSVQQPQPTTAAILSQQLHQQLPLQSIQQHFSIVKSPQQSGNYNRLPQVSAVVEKQHNHLREIQPLAAKTSQQLHTDTSWPQKSAAESDIFFRQPEIPMYQISGLIQGPKVSIQQSKLPIEQYHSYRSLPETEKSTHSSHEPLKQYEVPAQLERSIQQAEVPQQVPLQKPHELIQTPKASIQKQGPSIKPPNIPIQESRVPIQQLEYFTQLGVAAQPTSGPTQQPKSLMQQLGFLIQRTEFPVQQPRALLQQALHTLRSTSATKTESVQLHPTAERLRLNSHTQMINSPSFTSATPAFTYGSPFHTTTKLLNAMPAVGTPVTPNENDAFTAAPPQAITTIRVPELSTRRTRFRNSTPRSRTRTRPATSTAPTTTDIFPNSVETTISVPKTTYELPKVNVEPVALDKDENEDIIPDAFKVAKNARIRFGTRLKPRKIANLIWDDSNKNQ